VTSAAAVEADLREIVEARSDDPIDGSTVPAERAAELVGRHGLASTEALALLALPLAQGMARAAISGFEVSVVGIEAGSGDLVLGANLEFPGTELGTTVHAEGFVTLRARRRGRSLATLVVRDARPCAHCRQTLSEVATADDLVLVELAGNRRRLDDLYPLPFRPDALGIAGDDPGSVRWPDLSIQAGAAPPDVAGLLLEVGGRSHTPYSEAPSAVVLRLADGRCIGAGAMESVAFNPSISATQAALVELAAVRASGADIAEAWLGRLAGAPIDPEAGFRTLLGAVAPTARLRVVDWAS
jgi:cytidine deaminase